MAEEKENKGKGYIVGLCPWLIKDFAEILEKEGFAVVDLEEYPDGEKFPVELDAVAIDLAGEGSVELDRRIGKEIQNTPRILITARTTDLSDDHNAFALIHRPITAFS